MKYIVTWKMIAVLLLINIAVYVVNQFDHDFRIIVSNNSGAEVRDIEVHYAGCISKIPVLSRREEIVLYTEPRPGTVIEIRWLDEMSNEFFSGGIGYLTESSKGEITIDLRAAGRLAVHEDVQ